MGVFAYIKNGVKYKTNQFPGAYPANRVSYNGSDVETALDELNADITPKIIASGTAGGTFGSQLLELKNAYNSLDGDSRVKTVILIGPEIYRCNSFSGNGGVYTDSFCSSNTFYNDTLNVNNGTYYRCTLTGSGGASFTNFNNTVCSFSIRLCVY